MKPPCFTIIIHPELTVGVTADHESCVTGNIGVATATPAGGTAFEDAEHNPYYTYAWNNSRNTATISELAGGTYIVTVSDANNCTATNSIDIVANANPTISVVPTHVLCNGTNTGEIQVSVTSGTPYGDGSALHPYYYDFSNDGGSSTCHAAGTDYSVHTFTYLYADTYNIYVRDGNDCTVTEPVEITQPSQLLYFRILYLCYGFHYCYLQQDQTAHRQNCTSYHR